MRLMARGLQPDPYRCLGGRWSINALTRTDTQEYVWSGEHHRVQEINPSDSCPTRAETSLVRIADAAAEAARQR